MSTQPGVEAGQAAAEYLLCVSVLAVVLLLPTGEDDSVGAQLAYAFRNLFRTFSFLLSIS